MIEKRRRWYVTGRGAHPEVSLRLRELFSDSAEETAAWERIQEVLRSYREFQTYKPFLIDCPPNYRRVLLPWKNFGAERSFLMCSEQASMLIPGKKPKGWRRSDMLQFDAWETNPDSVGKGFGWFALAVEKHYEIAIFSKDRQRQIILPTDQDTFNNLREMIAPGCLPAELLSLVFEKHRLKRWKQLSQRSESLRIRADDCEDAVNALLKYRWYLDEL